MQFFFPLSLSLYGKRAKAVINLLEQHQHWYSEDKLQRFEPPFITWYIAITATCFNYHIYSDILSTPSTLIKKEKKNNEIKLSNF